MRNTDCSAHTQDDGHVLATVARQLFRLSNFVKTGFEDIVRYARLDCRHSIDGNALEHEKDKAFYEESGHQTVLDNITS